jgi:hypothetical protein
MDERERLATEGERRLWCTGCQQHYIGTPPKYFCTHCDGLGHRLTSRAPAEDRGARERLAAALRVAAHRERGDLIPGLPDVKRSNAMMFERAAAALLSPSQDAAGGANDCACDGVGMCTRHIEEMLEEHPSSPAEARDGEEGAKVGAYLRAWVVEVRHTWEGYWRQKEGHRYAHDFAAFVGERMLTDFDLRHVVRSSASTTPEETNHG